MNVYVNLPVNVASVTTTTRWARYMNSGATALELFNDEGESWCFASVNPLEWPAGLDRDSHMAVKDWSENEGMVEALVRAEIIYPAIVAGTRSGFVVIKFFKLTPNAIAERDAQLGTPELHEYAFDVTLFAAIRVKAPTQAEAEAKLRTAIDAASCNAGAWPNGDPIVFEASIEGALDLYEIDGESK